MRLQKNQTEASYCTIQTQNLASPTQKPRRSSEHWPRDSSANSTSLQGIAHHQNDLVHSHESTSPGHSSPDNSGLACTKKCCASCGVKHTPCWRPGWSEHVPLCNSCGLRYRKTKIYCRGCLYIPLRSEINASSKCPKCLEDFRQT
ncbi:hypothetical protein K493DRAFT_410491 [Basidiobolus meristosporus CBS 931.73]|uniref:GATA-type domain-containing protein n=1 Tax=Basidiobolus meristosporus CBS 931.73 TaxID=1314790 RepID=A0A1Y1XUC2_9FUNG|nr:hypothetical protein K493DRAFT_410491 [Basidiobolus meristosporus CBS 931.73]|eukprot:ORX89348.1 hypothetical protein K493DRAFT_410491 [Basidiobolus meristosporus CBS 931.73]